MAYDDARLPVDIEKGSSGGPGFYTTVISSQSGSEQRNSKWADQRGLWTVAFAMRRKSEQDTILTHFYGRRGMAHSFPFKDWTDYQATGEELGTGDGVVDDVGFPGHRAGTADYQLIRVYGDAVRPFTRYIFKPVVGTITVFVDAVSTAFTLQPHGIVRFANANIPLVGEDITATFQFDVPVRYGSDRLIKQPAHGNAYAIPSLELVEVFPPNY